MMKSKLFITLLLFYSIINISLHNAPITNTDRWDLVPKQTVHSTTQPAPNTTVWFKDTRSNKIINDKTLQGLVSINWEAYYTKENISLDYTINGGLTWNPLVRNLLSTQFLWNTSTIEDSKDAQLRVKVRDLNDQSRNVEFTTPKFFIINSLLKPNIVYPTTGSNLVNRSFIKWFGGDLKFDVSKYGLVGIDKKGHNATFHLFISYNSGSEWNYLRELNPWFWRLNASYYEFAWDTRWDTQNSQSCKLKILLNSTSGFEVYGISEGTFSLSNTVHYISPEENNTLDTQIPIMASESYTVDRSFPNVGGPGTILTNFVLPVAIVFSIVALTTFLYMYRKKKI